MGIESIRRLIPVTHDNDKQQTPLTGRCVRPAREPGAQGWRYTVGKNESLPPSTVRFPFNLIRIDGDASFEGNGRSFDGHAGGAVSNTDGGTTMYDAMDERLDLS